MQVKKLQLKDWLSHSDTTIDLEPLTVIRGANGVGKSSIAQALEYLLTGRCSSTDDRGSGAKECIRGDSDRTSITAEILDPDLRKIRAALSEKSPRSMVLKKDGDPTWNGSDYLTYLTLNRDVLSCLLNGRYFIDLPEARQKDLLAEIVLPLSYEWPADIVGLVNQVFPSTNWASAPFDLIGSVYDQAFESRKLVNRQLKDWRDPEAVEPATQAVDEIRSRLKQRQDERTAVAIERQRILDKRSAAIGKQEKASQKVAKLNAKLAEERGNKLSAQERILSEDRLANAKKTAANADQAKALDDQMAAIQRELAEVVKTGDALNKFADDPKCPTCTQVVSREVLDAILAPLAAKRLALTAEYQTAGDSRKALGDPVGAQRQIAEHTQALSDMKLVEAKLKELGEEFAQEQAQDSIPEADTTAEDRKLAELDKRIEAGNQALTKAIQREAKRAEYDKATAAKKSLDEQLVRLERLVEYFGPKGVQAELLEKHVNAFEGRLNRVMNKWGYECQLHFDPYVFTVGFLDAKKGFSLRTISDSQRYRFAAAFQIALASATGIRMAVIDAADILDNDGRRSLFGALREAIGTDIDQAVVLATDERREHPEAEGVIFYMLSLDKSGDIPTTTIERL